MQILSHMLISSRPVVAVAILASLLAGCALPLASESELETESDKQFAKMRTGMVVSNDAQTRAYINCVSAAVIRELERPYSDKEWDVEVFESEDINAFAMPGGHIGVYTGILNVAENQDQLATVIGHEVAHVTQQHALNRVNREMTTQAGVIAGSAVLGGGQATGQLLSMGAQLGLSLPYGRAQESDADVVGLKYMAAAGFNPQQSIQLWKNMAKKSKLGPAPFLSTHPSGDTRIQDLIGQLPSALKLYNEAQAAGKKPACHP